mmetsp:Transcript_136625/g.346004  ORF Transcript_136625/g.346004 Transcript_136625/m.346004 type:complete len:217 (-) Transcript_136625:455-1105(-)
MCCRLGSKGGPGSPPHHTAQKQQRSTMPPAVVRPLLPAPTSRTWRFWPGLASQHGAVSPEFSLTRTASATRSRTYNTGQLGSMSPQSSLNLHIARTLLRTCQEPAGDLTPESVLESALGPALKLVAWWEFPRQQAWEPAKAAAHCQKQRRRPLPRRRKTRRSRQCSCTPTAIAKSRAQRAYRPEARQPGGSVHRSCSARRNHRRGRPNGRGHQSNP